jgi:hypothetical protein
LYLSRITSASYVDASIVFANLRNIGIDLRSVVYASELAEESQKDKMTCLKMLIAVQGDLSAAY